MNKLLVISFLVFSQSMIAAEQRVEIQSSFSPIAQAIIHNDDKALIKLIAYDRTLLNKPMQDLCNDTPLQAAIRHAVNFNIIEMLIKKGADVNVISPMGENLLIILTGFNKSAWDMHNTYVVKKQVEENIDLYQTEIARLLIKKGLDRIAKPDCAGNSALQDVKDAVEYQEKVNKNQPHALLQKCSPELMKLFQPIYDKVNTGVWWATIHSSYHSYRFDFSGAMTEMAIGKGLLKDLEENLTANVELLLDRGANINKRARALINYHDVSTALEWAICHECHEIVKLLFDRGIDIEHENGERALMLAVGKGHTETVKLLLNRCKHYDDAFLFLQLLRIAYTTEPDYSAIAQLLINKCVNVDLVMISGLTPLMTAAQCGEYKIADMLLDKGAIIDKATSAGYTALMIAVENGYYDIAQLLIDRGAHINAVDDFGSSVVFHAVANNNYNSIKITELLLERGVLIDSKITYHPIIISAQSLDILKKMSQVGHLIIPVVVAYYWSTLGK